MTPRRRSLLAFVAAALCAIVLASVSHSQFVLNRLANLGVVIPADVRALVSLDDLLGLLPSYGVVITLGLGLAFALTAWLLRRGLGTPALLYPLAGAVAFAAMLLLMHPILEITLIAGARSAGGFIGQCLAGAVAGGLFAALNRAPNRKP
ncbi:hypothetical protein [Aestuariirhabdus litorea]|uniref:Uncharacterized protein n=1 Tax=Aestuariirhabdus litorea TaxID=2528527 RepID=A0A3P3VLW4_9GAMM|nr:hypothetical protein [Aestuariirhabdus litorea]RRJ83761.1 hypothetical protein D0544_01170 [Aestuariirhabdus litorea]RWW96984.1 hypothetical protein DZC74_01170 [Endozoicomonadaceae bacterium GTF-13]